MELVPHALPSAAAQERNRAKLPNTVNLDRLLRFWIVICSVVGGLLFASQLLEIRWRSALRGYDNTFNYLWLRSLAVDRDWDFRNDIETTDTLAPDHRISALTLPLTPAGRIPNKYGVGWALLSAPAYLVADVVVAIGQSFGIWDYARDGYGPVYQFALQFGQLALALLGLWLATRAIAAWTGSESAARFGVATVWAASPLLYYQTANLSMSHSAAFFAVALFAYALVRTTSTVGVGWWALAGGAWALAVITRFQLALFGVVGLWALWSMLNNDSAAARDSDVSASRKARSSRAGFAKSVVTFLAGAAPLLFLQFWAWRVVYGEWLVFSYGAEGESFHWSHPELWNSLFSSWHGLFYWHPYLFVACAGLGAWAISRRGTALAWAVALTLTTYVSASWWCWWFASSFGNRSYDAALLPMMAGAAWLMQQVSSRWRALLFLTAIAAGVWNFYVVLLYRSAAISRSAPVTWSEMVQAAQRLPEVLRF